jgi:hypothetical protein
MSKNKIKWDCNTPLNRLLKINGFTTSKAKNGIKHILCGGETVFTGRAHDVSAWLKKEAK